jgi:hypothetical protein
MHGGQRLAGYSSPVDRLRDLAGRRIGLLRTHNLTILEWRTVGRPRHPGSILWWILGGYHNRNDGHLCGVRLLEVAHQTETTSPCLPDRWSPVGPGRWASSDSRYSRNFACVRTASRFLDVDGGLDTAER